MDKKGVVNIQGLGVNISYDEDEILFLIFTFWRFHVFTTEHLNLFNQSEDYNILAARIIYCWKQAWKHKFAMWKIGYVFLFFCLLLFFIPSQNLPTAGFSYFHFIFSLNLFIFSLIP